MSFEKFNLENIVLNHHKIICNYSTRGNLCEKLFHNLDQGRVIRNYCLHFVEFLDKKILNVLVIFGLGIMINNNE